MKIRSLTNIFQKLSSTKEITNKNPSLPAKYLHWSSLIKFFDAGLHDILPAKQELINHRQYI